MAWSPALTENQGTAPEPQQCESEHEQQQRTARSAGCGSGAASALAASPCAADIFFGGGVNDNIFADWCVFGANTGGAGKACGASTARPAAAIIAALKALASGDARHLVRDTLAVVTAFTLEAAATRTIAAIVAARFPTAVRNAVGHTVKDARVGNEATDLGGIRAVY